MSLILNEILHVPQNARNEGSLEDHRDLANLDRYLSIIANNQKACHFVPNDAMVALDMAGFVRGQLYSNRNRASISTARLALSLVQPCAPIQ